LDVRQLRLLLGRCGIGDQRIADPVVEGGNEPPEQVLQSGKLLLAENGAHLVRDHPGYRRHLLQYASPLVGQCQQLATSILRIGVPLDQPICLEEAKHQSCG
jgi:hypothetical protein